MISKLFIICLFVMSSVISSDDFCQHFRQNKDRIQFPFRRDFDTNDKTLTKINIVIRGKCWVIDFKHHPNDAEPTLTLDQQSKDCPIFAADYTFGLCLNTRKFDVKYSCNAYLFNLDSAKGVIAQIPDDKHIDYKDLSEYKMTSDLTISGHELAKNFVSVFQSDKNTTKGMLIFVWVTANKIVAKLFDFDLKEKEIALKEDDHTKISKDFPVLNGSTIENNELLALISQYNQKESKKSGSDGWGFILLEKKDATISWCWTPSQNFDCKPKVLVNCGQVSAVTDPPHPSEASPEEDAAKPWLIPAVITIAVIVVILIIVIIAFVIKKRNSGHPKPTTVSSSASAKESTNVSKGFSSAFAKKNSKK